MNQQNIEPNQSDTLTCYRHPERETLLRCNQCDRPICSSCAIRTPTGYRCPECVRSQEKKFDTAQLPDYILACLLSAGIAFFGSYVARFLGFFTLLIAPVVSMIISEGILKLTRGRSSTLLTRLVLVSAILGSLPLLLVGLYNMFTYLSLYGLSAIGSFLSTIWQAGYTIIMATTLRARTKGLYIG
ncbi:MAG TPA: hypothetical protein PLL88_07285 [Anaerolineaceae bacterium]|jgi:hypothetical protein|nr:hypothetical protein [Anaerolineaceae bacterium]